MLKNDSTLSWEVSFCREAVVGTGPSQTSEDVVTTVTTRYPCLPASTGLVNKFAMSFIGASQELKHLRLAVSPGASTVRSGRRWSSLQSHLEPALYGGRLHVLLNTQVSRVTFRGSRARGVMLQSHKVTARREVILCTGAVGTPHLLQLSGVGPRPLLERHGVSAI